MRWLNYLQESGEITVLMYLKPPWASLNRFHCVGNPEIFQGDDDEVGSMEFS